MLKIRGVLLQAMAYQVSRVRCASVLGVLAEEDLCEVVCSFMNLPSHMGTAATAPVVNENFAGMQLVAAHKS